MCWQLASFEETRESAVRCARVVVCLNVRPSAVSTLELGREILALATREGARGAVVVYMNESRAGAGGIGSGSEQWKTR
jgi:hypothetical protein